MNDKDRNFFGLRKKNKFEDKEVIDKLVFALENASYIEDACAYAGITSATFRTWRNKAEAGEEVFENIFKRIRDAEAICKVEMLRTIKVAGEEGNIRALQWIMERKYPSQFGETSKLQINTEEVIELDMKWADGELYSDFQNAELIEDTDTIDTIEEEQEKKEDVKMDNHE